MIDRIRMIKPEEEGKVICYCCGEVVMGLVNEYDEKGEGEWIELWCMKCLGENLRDGKVYVWERKEEEVREK